MQSRVISDANKNSDASNIISSHHCGVEQMKSQYDNRFNLTSGLNLVRNQPVTFN